MASLFDLVQQYLKRDNLPETFKYDRTPPIGTNPPGLFPQPPIKPIEKILPRPGGNEEGFSVYNPDPNRTRTPDRYSPYNYRQAAERNLIGDVYSSGTAAQKMMDNYPEYYEGPQLTGIPGMVQGYMKNSIPGQLIGNVVGGINNLLPVNRRAIYENELLGQGIMLNDIGQIVSDGGNINTAENIMAGYNANKVTAETFQKRRDMINDKMSDKVNPKTGKTYKEEKLAALDAAEDKFFGASGKATTVFNDKLKQKDIDDGFINDQGSTYDEEIPSFLTNNTIASNNIIEGTNSNDYDGINSLDKIITGINKPGGFLTTPKTITSGSVLADKNINRIIDDVDIPSSGNDNNAGFNPGVTPGKSGFIGIDKDMDVSPFDFDDAATYEPPSNNYPDYSNVKTGGPPSQGGGGGGPPSQGGTHCCTAANKRGDMTLTEVKKLRAWHRKQSKIWQKGYDVWGRVIADNLVAKFKWQSDRVRDFYNHKIYGKKTIGSIYADIVIYPMSMIIGFILTVMPPILGYQENKRHG